MADPPASEPRSSDPPASESGPADPAASPANGTTVTLRRLPRLAILFVFALGAPLIAVLVLWRATSSPAQARDAVEALKQFRIRVNQGLSHKEYCAGLATLQNQVQPFLKRPAIGETARLQAICRDALAAYLRAGALKRQVAAQSEADPKLLEAIEQETRAAEAFVRTAERFVPP